MCTSHFVYYRLASYYRGRGAVVVVSSGACSQITPQMTVYAGTKVRLFRLVHVFNCCNDYEMSFEFCDQYLETSVCLSAVCVPVCDASVLKHLSKTKNYALS